MTHAHDRGLAYDLQRLREMGRLLDRRGALRIIGAVPLFLVAACGGDSDDDAATASTSSSSTTSASAPSSTSASTSSSSTCETIPSETGGPFPGDGTNGPNALTQSGVVRSDIRSSFGSASGVAQGVPLKVNLTILQKSNGCKSYAGAAVYLWHCDRDGLYSMYSQGAENENYLRGVQAADSSGRVSFTSIFPAAYSGRWPHIHFEIFSSLANATSAGSKLKTSQLALPADACNQVYATDGYASSRGQTSRSSIASDNVFADGSSLQVASAAGSPAAGYTAELAVTV